MLQSKEWRCEHCGKLLGITSGNRLRIRLRREKTYIVGLPAMTTCWRCNAPNELRVGHDDCRREPNSQLS